MQRVVLLGLTMLFTVFLILFLNGNIHLTKDPLPPFGKFLNPFGGVWSSNTLSEIKPGNFVLHGVKDSVEIYYDERHIPHIFAKNLEDALFAQGFVEAQNRLFQMHFMSMAAAGQLSSIIGTKTLAYDISKRRRGMIYAAENAVKGWEATGKDQHLKAYINGVNAYSSQLKYKDLPLEFKLFDFKPQEWSALQSALIFKEMTLTLAGLNEDVAFTNLLASLGQDDFNMLYPERMANEEPVIPIDYTNKFDSISVDKFDQKVIFNKVLPNAYFEKPQAGVGSNSWAVSGNKTASNRPIFCNDPHLSLGLPSIWFELHIHTPRFNAYGVSFPGFPGIMIGFNDHIAWGETNVGQDVSDYFLIEWQDTSRTSYLLDEKLAKPTYRIETINVKGQKTIYDTIPYTYFGPIYRQSNDAKNDLALRWIAHDTPATDEYNTFVAAMQCTNYDEFIRETSRFNSPGQNFTFAAKDGTIGLRVNGKFPAKSKNDGRFVERGNSTENNWNTWIPRKHNPQITNPTRGYISSANQVSADKTYPYYFNGKFERYRNQAINSILDTMQNITPFMMQKMQQNTFSVKAKNFIEYFISVKDSIKINPQNKMFFDQILAWNCHYDADSEQPTLFAMLLENLKSNTWDEIKTLSENMDVVYPEDWVLLELLDKNPYNKYFDIKSTSKLENAYDIIAASIDKMGADFLAHLAEKKSTSWGAYKAVHIKHLARIPGLSEENISTNGNHDVINANNVTFGPSWRMIVSLTDEIEAYGAYPGGQSGNPGSKYYKNMLEYWRTGQYYKLNNSSDPSSFDKSIYQKIGIYPSKS